MAISNVTSQRISVLAYAPIALFAESLRVQFAMASSIITRSSVAPAMTGCVKDLLFLWEMNESHLLGNFDDRDVANVTSVRHGNSFRLHNQAVLLLSQVCGRKANQKIIPYRPDIGELAIRRETIVNLSFVLPHNNLNNMKRVSSRLELLCFLITFIEFGVPIAIAVEMALNGIIVGVVLMLCLSFSVAALTVLRLFTSSIIANRDAIARDVQEASPTLDIHVIARHWNDTHLDVVCGYTSHLHALTNIQMVVDRFPLLRWVSRFIAVILVIQAAILASLLGTKDNSWIALLWMAIYLYMLIPPYLLKHYSPDSLYQKHSAELIKIQPIHFFGRRAALLFISMLPVTPRADVDRWAWMDVFMPDSDRRRRWRAHVEAQNIVTGKSTYCSLGKQLSVEDEKNGLIAKTAVEQASAAYNHPEILKYLLAYSSRLGKK